MVPPGILLLIGVCYMLCRTALPVCSQNAIPLRFLVSAILTVISHSDSYIARAFSFDFRIEWRTSGNGAGRIERVLVQYKRMQKIPHNARQSPGVSGRDDPDSAVIRRKMILLLFYTFSNRMYCFSGRCHNALRSIFTVSGCRKIKNHGNTLLNRTSASGCFSATARKNSAPSPEYAPEIIAIFIHALLLYPSCFGHLQKS